MGLNCGCPAGAHIAELEIADCKESLGQIQKVIFQRVYSSAGTKNSLTSLKKANFASVLTANDGTKMQVSPYIQGPETEPGAARTFGGGNQTLGGIEITIGREPTTFSGTIYQENQKLISQLKTYMCETIGVWLIDENGNIGCLAEESTSDNVTTTKYMPIPVGKFFVGDKKLGGFEEPDSNAIEWSFYPNWSDNLVIVKAEDLDFNPLTDLANVVA
jgi:hypothetical protein